MANSSTIGAAATTLASLPTLFWTIFGFTSSISPQRLTEQVFVGYALMGWLGVCCLALGWGGAAFTFNKQHFRLAIAGAAAVFVSCWVEAVFLLYLPTSRIGVSVDPIVYYVPMVVVQGALSFSSIVFTAKSKKLFT